MSYGILTNCQRTFSQCGLVSRKWIRGNFGESLRVPSSGGAVRLANLTVWFSGVIVDES